MIFFLATYFEDIKTAGLMEFDSCSTESPVFNKTEVDLELSLDELDAILEVDVVDTIPPVNITIS